VGAAVRVSFAEPRTVTAVRSDQDTLTLSETRAMFGTVKADSADMLFMAVTSVLTGRGQTSVPIGTTSTVLLDRGVTVQVIAARPGAIELTVVGVIVVGLITLVVIGLTLAPT
jgi:hypothetical protein